MAMIDCAPSILQWGRGPKTAESTDFPRGSRRQLLDFNGAAVRRPRREAQQAAMAADSISLQWGRGPKTAESRLALGEPLAQICRFNGAAVRRPRRVDKSLHPSALNSRLQWGRGPKTAESYLVQLQHSGLRHRFNGAAVRRPRRDRPPHGSSSKRLCFNGAAVRRPRREKPPSRGPLVQRASMGPRSEDRGESNLTSVGTLASLLQWGRGPKTAESQNGRPNGC